MRIVSYRGAYCADTIDLCAHCAERPPWPLGPVEHGLHEGECEGVDCPTVAGSDRAQTTGSGLRP